MPDISKRVSKHISTVVDVANLTWKLLRATKQLEFGVVSWDPIQRKQKTSITHTVNLTDDELKHLDKGGKIIVIHACGHQEHVKI